LEVWEALGARGATPAEPLELDLGFSGPCLQKPSKPEIKSYNG